MRRPLTSLTLAALALLVAAPALAQVRLPELDAATTPLGDADLFLVRQDGEPRDEKVTWANVRASLQDALTLVLGPAAACADNQLARWNGASNTALQCSPLTVADTTGDITAPGALTISTAGSNGDIILDAAGTGTVQAPGQGTYADDHVQIGPGAIAGSTTTTDNAGTVAIGRNANATSSTGQVIAIGDSANASNTGSIVIGAGSLAGSGGSLVLGHGSTGRGGMVIGHGSSLASTGHTASMVLGASATTTAANQAVIGGNDQFTTLYYNGVTDATPTGIVVNATGGSGTDIAGASLTLAGGKGTGKAAGGAVLIQTSDPGASGTTLQTLATRVTVGVERTTIANILSLTGIAAAPGSPAAGDIVYDSDNNLFCGYNGSAWVSFSGAGTCWRR